MGTADNIRLKGCPKQLFVAKAVLVRARSADSVCSLVTAELTRTGWLRVSLMVYVAANKVQPLVVQR